MKQRAISVLGSQLTFIVLLGLCSLSTRADTSTCPDNAQQYWKAFRVSVLRRDLTAVADASRFPFLVSGTLDESEKKHVDRNEFSKLFSVLLKADPGLSPTPTTMKALVKSTTRLSRPFCNSHGNQFRVGGWVFELTPEGWRFVQAFVDDE